MSSPRPCCPALTPEEGRALGAALLRRSPARLHSTIKGLACTPTSTASAAGSTGCSALLWEAGGTDLLLTVGLPPMLRVDGALSPAPGAAALTRERHRRAARRGADAGPGARPGTTSHEYDFSFSWRDHARIRGNAFTQRGLTAVALRMIPRDDPDASTTLGLPPVLRELSLAAPGPGAGDRPDRLRQVDHARLADRPDQHATAAATSSPSRTRSSTSTTTTRRRSTSARSAPTPASFPDALRAALREDPDVLLVGEMRDLESIQFALTIAETGHLVFATLHTNDTAQSLDRIIDVFPAEQQAQIRVQLAAALERRRLPAADPADRRRHDRGLRGAGRDPRGAQPDPGGQDPPAAQRAGHRRPRRHETRSSSRCRAWSSRASSAVDDAVARSLYPKDIEVRPR